MAKRGRLLDAHNVLRSGEVGKYFKYYDEWSGQWVYHILDEGILKDLTICVPVCGDDIEDIYLYFEDVPFARRRGAPPGARYDDTPILRRMAQIRKASGEHRPRRLAILAVSQMKLKLNGAQRESVIKRFTVRWKDFIRNNPTN